MFKFENLEVWKKAVNLYEQISLLSRSIDQRDQFSLGEQIRKAALSVSKDMAEEPGEKVTRKPNMSSISLRVRTESCLVCFA